MLEYKEIALIESLIGQRGCAVPYTYGMTNLSQTPHKYLYFTWNTCTRDNTGPGPGHASNSAPLVLFLLSFHFLLIFIYSGDLKWSQRKLLFPFPSQNPSCICAPSLCPPPYSDEHLIPSLPVRRGPLITARSLRWRLHERKKHQILSNRVQAVETMFSMPLRPRSSGALAILSWTLSLVLSPTVAAAASAADYYVHDLPGAPEGPLLKMHAG